MLSSWFRLNLANLRAGAAAAALLTALSAGAAHADTLPTFSITGGTAFDLNSAFGTFSSQAFNPNGTMGNNTASNLLYGSLGTVIGTGGNSAGANYGTASNPANAITIFTQGSTGGLEISNYSSSVPVSLTFTFLGYEAADTNEAASFGYSAGSNTISFDNQASSAATGGVGAQTIVQESLTSPPSLLPFIYTTLNGPDGQQSAQNGGTVGSDVAIGFMVDPTDPNIAYAFLEDIWQGGDQDFDDMVVEISANLQSNTIGAATPLPGALALFAGGLGLFGFAGARRRGRKSAPSAFAEA